MGTHDINKSQVLLKFSICIFPNFFMLFLMNLGAPSWVLGVRMITWIVFIGFKFFGICITWVKILDGIEDGHHNSLNMRLMAGHVI